MADSKKYNGSTWEHSLRKLTTSTDTFTTLPADLYANAATATVGLKGNMTQTGTPTSSDPIQPQGTGERTGNLVDADSYYASYKSGNSYTATTSQFNTTIISPFTTSDIGKTYTISCDITEISSTNVRWLATINGVSVNGDGRSSTGQIKLTFTVATANDSLKITYGSGNYTLTIANVMMNEGSAPIPYEPYGYKIPISSANTTTPVYLGEVETTRRIKKLVLTGEENWILYALSGAVNVERFFIVLSQNAISGGNIIVSTHFPTETDNSDTEHIRCGGASSNEMYIYISRLVATTSAELKSYLAAQYAAGTPVTVWYVLANETTGIVNEPLMRIGNYADTVSGITIPTITSKDTFDVDTTLKPSEVSLGYTGWHDATVEEWDGSQWNE